jgi:hypothetical protein
LDFHGRTRNIGSLAIVLGFIIPFSVAGPASADEVEPEKINTSNAQTLVVTSSVTPSIYLERFELVIESAPVVVVNNASVSLPSFSGGSLLDAARAQIGKNQDCTGLVENALRMLGYSIGDVGPMGFGAYGVQVSPSSAQPGDIMMRGGHVAIYAGGTAIHGGYNGTTVESYNDSNPHNYAVIIRVQ